MADSSDESVGEESVLQVNKRKQPEKWKRNVRKETRAKSMLAREGKLCRR